MFVLVVVGKKDSGKTSAITSIVESIRNNSKSVSDLLLTQIGKRLNKNGGKRDCFELIEKSGFKIGILSAGDLCDDFNECIIELLSDRPNILICAARKWARPSILNEIKKSSVLRSAEYINIEEEGLTTIDSIEKMIRKKLTEAGYQSIL